MGEDVLEIAIPKAGLKETQCKTRDVPIHGYKKEIDLNAPRYYYGTDEERIQSLAQADRALGEKIHVALPFIKAEIIWAVRHEMCMTVEDFLSRRTRALMLDARCAIESAPLVAEIMAKEMQKNNKWIEAEIDHFNSIAKNYLPSANLEHQTSN